MATKRQLSEPTGLRFFEDQVAWLAEMEETRSVNPHALVRAAVDHYRPVYEASHAPGHSGIAEQAAELADEFGEDAVRAALEAFALSQRVTSPDSAPAGR